jgi:1-deoxyxylulose-5-phosphate synthase
MRHIRLGRTGLPVSRLCLGTMTFGQQCDEATSHAILDRAGGGGITLLLFRQIERELLPLCEEEGVGVIPCNPLAGGLLTGKHARGGAPTPGTRFPLGTAGARYQDRYWHEREFATVEDIRKVAADVGVPMAQLAVSWVLAHPAVISAIVGASRPEQIADLVPAASADLPADVKAQLDALTEDYRMGDDPR